ncbi:MAG: phenylacetate--CoA ligase family protein, partial [Kordia sp.]
MLHKLIFQLGERFRNPSIRKWFTFLKQSENWSVEELEAYQFKQLKELVSLAEAHSDDYKEKFAAFDTASFSSLADIARLPIWSKEDVL